MNELEMLAIRTLSLEYLLTGYRNSSVAEKLAQIQLLAMIEEIQNPDSDGWV